MKQINNIKTPSSALNNSNFFIKKSFLENAKGLSKQSIPINVKIKSKNNKESSELELNKIIK